MRIFTLSILLLLLLIQNIHSQTQLTIAEAREANMDGTLVREGETVILEGKAIGPNFNPNLGTQFIIVDISGPIGITVFSNTDNFGYEVTDFDNLRITGELTSFNGLAEIVPTSIDVLPPGGFNPTIRIVDNLGEDTESILVTYNDATLSCRSWPMAYFGEL